MSAATTYSSSSVGQGQGQGQGTQAGATHSKRPLDLISGGAMEEEGLSHAVKRLAGMRIEHSQPQAQPQPQAQAQAQGEAALVPHAHVPPSRRRRVEGGANAGAQALAFPSAVHPSGPSKRKTGRGVIPLSPSPSTGTGASDSESEGEGEGTGAALLPVLVPALLTAQPATVHTPAPKPPAMCGQEEGGDPVTFTSPGEEQSQGQGQGPLVRGVVVVTGEGGVMLPPVTRPVLTRGKSGVRFQAIPAQAEGEGEGEGMAVEGHTSPGKRGRDRRHSPPPSTGTVGRASGGTGVGGVLPPLVPLGSPAMAHRLALRRGSRAALLAAELEEEAEAGRPACADESMGEGGGCSSASASEGEGEEVQPMNTARLEAWLHQGQPALPYRMPGLPFSIPHGLGRGHREVKPTHTHTHAHAHHGAGAGGAGAAGGATGDTDDDEEEEEDMAVHVRVADAAAAAVLQASSDPRRALGQGTLPLPLPVPPLPLASKAMALIPYTPPMADTLLQQAGSSTRAVPLHTYPPSSPPKPGAGAGAGAGMEVEEGEEGGSGGSGAGGHFSASLARALGMGIGGPPVTGPVRAGSGPPFWGTTFRPSSAPSLPIPMPMPMPVPLPAASSTGTGAGGEAEVDMG